MDFKIGLKQNAGMIKTMNWNKKVSGFSVDLNGNSSKVEASYLNGQSEIILEGKAVDMQDTGIQLSYLAGVSVTIVNSELIKEVKPKGRNL